MNPLLAKSKTGGHLSLYDHTAQVREAIIRFAKAFGIDVKLAEWGAILHDLGKAHPAFQAVLIAYPKIERDDWLKKLPARTAIEEELDRIDLYTDDLRDPRVPVRHELVSLLFLPLFPETIWPVLVELVVGHHKSVRRDKSERGLLDLISEHGGSSALFERYAANWDDWAPSAIEIAVSLGVERRDISQREAKAAFKKAVALTQQITKVSGVSTWRGLLMAADHFASGYQAETTVQLERLFRRPDLTSFDERAIGARAALYPLSRKPIDDGRPHSLITAPTGAGKTDFLIRRCRGGARIFYTLPFQASINAMWRRLSDDMEGTPVTRLHSASAVPLKANEETIDEDVDMQRHPGAAVKVLTPHQLAALVFALPGHETVALDIAGQHVILDEVHTYNGASRAMVVRLVTRLRHLGCHVHIGTATLPVALAARLIHELGGPGEVYEVDLTIDELNDFDRHVVYKSSEAGESLDLDGGRDVVTKAVAAGEKVLTVSNRIADAQDWFNWAQDAFPGIPVMLIHSRYKRADRALLEQQVMRLSERDGACVCVATQVVEVSLDISFDRLITDAAPLDSLVQRFGRVNRKRSIATIGRYKPVHVLAPAKTAKEVRPYDLEIVRASYALLPDGEVLRERSVTELMTAVYPEVDIASIEAHFAVDEYGLLHRARLTNVPRSVIVDALEISGERVILADDAQEYANGDFRSRPLFEIPVSDSFTRIHPELGRSPYGSRPLIVPNDWYSFGTTNLKGVGAYLTGGGLQSTNVAQYL